MYVPAEELDPLSRLFLQVLQYERSIPRLVRAFGLTERVVEDVLGDLIRRNRAALVIKKNGNNEIRPLDNAIPNLVYTAGDVFDVWQDHATGIVLPAWVVDKLEQRGASHVGDGQQLTIGGSSRLIDDFLEAPDAQLIEMLIRSDEELRENEGAFGTLDRLADRFRLRPQILWVPVTEATFGSYRIRQIVADEIPTWVTRVWSVALRGQGADFDEPDVGSRIAAAVANKDAEAKDIMHGWRIAAGVDLWRSAVESFLRIAPAPISGYELRDVRERQAALVGLLSSISQVEIAFPDANLSARLQKLLTARLNWMVLVLPRVSDIERVLSILKGLLTQDSVPSTFFILTPKTLKMSAYERELSALPAPAPRVFFLEIDWPTDAPLLAVGENTTVLLQTAPASDVLQFSGERLASEWLSSIQSVCPVSKREVSPGTKRDTADSAAERDLSKNRRQASALLHQLRFVRSAPMREHGARLGLSVDSPTLEGAIGELRAFGDALLAAIVDPGSMITDTSSESFLQVGAISVSFNKRKSLGEQLPALSDRLDELCNTLSFAPTETFATWTRLNSYDLVATLIAVLTEPTRRVVESSIDILATGIGDEVLSPDFLTLIEAAVGRFGWNIRIGLPPKNLIGLKQFEAIEALRLRVPSQRLQLMLLKQHPPASVLIVDDVVFLSTADWLKTALKQKLEPSEFGLAFESHDFAESLKANFIDAQEIPG